MTRFIRDLMAGTPEMLDAFGDAALVRHACAFEAALANASAAVGLIERSAADKIAQACAAFQPDYEALARDAAHAGTLAIPLVAHLRKQAGSAVHMGATSQDVADTALVLQMKDGAALLDRDLKRLMAAVRSLAQQHAKTPMSGRTLLQAALPITFGLKCAMWFSALRDDLGRLRREQTFALTLQFGGGAGTRTGLNGKGAAIAKHMAAELGLTCAPSWHTQRNNLIAVANSVALIIATLGKIAGDLALLSQSEIGEVAEPAIPGRGGSSAMAHKRNPTGCQIALSAAVRAPGLASGLLTPNAHERGLGAWQAEAPIIADLFILAHGALSAMVTVVEGLEVKTEAMRENLDRAGIGHDTGDAEALVADVLAGD